MALGGLDEAGALVMTGKDTQAKIANARRILSERPDCDCNVCRFAQAELKRLES